MPGFDFFLGAGCACSAPESTFIPENIMFSRVTPGVLTVDSSLESGVSIRNGFTLVELMVTLVVVSATVAIGTLAMAPTLARETMRSTLHDAGSLVQLARVESVRRNRECRFIVDPGTRTMSVVDKNGTATTSDDIVLRTTRIPPVVSFARPDAGSPITFTLTGSTYTIDLHPDGYVSAGSGEMVMFSGGRFNRLQVYAAGGVRYEKWADSAWQAGS